MLVRGVSLAMFMISRDVTTRRFYPGAMPLQKLPPTVFFGEFLAYSLTVVLMTTESAAKVSEIDFSQAVVWLRS